MELTPEPKLVGYTLNRAYARIHAVDCTPAERALIASKVDAAELEALADALRQALRADGPMPCVRALFLGRSPSLSTAPEWVRRVRRELLPCWAVWVRELGSIVVILDDKVRIRRVLIHEFAHALLDLLSSHHAFPIAIDEGFAWLLEHRITASDQEEWRGGAALRSGVYPWALPEGWFMSIRELLAFDLASWAASADMVEYRRMSRCAWWLIAWWTHVEQRRDPAYGPLLAELVRRKMCDPEAIRELMARMLRTDVADLERRFRQYCLSRGSSGAGEQRRDIRSSNVRRPDESQRPPSD